MNVCDIAQQVSSAKLTADPHTEELSFQGNKRSRCNILSRIAKQSDTWLYRQEEPPTEDINFKRKINKLERKKDCRYYLREERMLEKKRFILHTHRLYNFMNRSMCGYIDTYTCFDIHCKLPTNINPSPSSEIHIFYHILLKVIFLELNMAINLCAIKIRGFHVR